ncbi:Telomere end binding protein [Penicillium paradoxum]|uniref:Telomere end binding protein n=1 Tax=Penicillium paradoxum TaxID=176176 RepID=UPI002546E2E6|nr:Telomere end binding protein [Penicillium paradoxum]KAJ5795212.1 Telomere end binding protein [Penicillium paradoxum]
MDAREQPPASNALAHLTKVPIAQLSPDLDNVAEKSFLANVALVWPYSSSAKSLSLLLVEPDVLLRRALGQIKVTFRGRVAERVAESHVGIGETIGLALKDCNFVSNADSQQTPGRCIAWDAHFANGVTLEIYRSSQDPLTISVEPQLAAPQTELALPTTPSGKSTNSERDLTSSTGLWGSPVFLKPTRTSLEGTIRSAFDPFAEEDGFVPGKGRKRPRYSLQREDWRVLTEPESSQEEDVPVDWLQVLDQDIEHELDEAHTPSEPSDDLMSDPDEIPEQIDTAPQEPSPIFVKPSLELTGSIIERRAGESNNLSSHEQVDVRGTSFQLPTDTPQIRPIPSPGLPIPSPIVSSNATSSDYFPPWNASTQVQETQSVPMEIETIATLPEPSIETRETKAISPPKTEMMKVPEPFIEPAQEEHILDSGFQVHGDTEPSSSPADAPLNQEIDLVDSFGPIDALGVSQANIITHVIGEEAQISNEIQQDIPDDGDLSGAPSESSSGSEDESDDSSEIMDESADRQIDDDAENISNEAQTSDEAELGYIVDDEPTSRESSVPPPRSEGESIEPPGVIDAVDTAQTDVGIQIAGETTGSPSDVNGLDDEEIFDPTLQSLDRSHPIDAFDQDAIDALEMMRATREEEFEDNRIKRDEVRMEADIDHPSKQNDSEEEDERLEDHAVYDGESVQSYNSQYDSDEEEIHYPPSETGLNQDDFDIEDDSDEEFERDRDLPSRVGDPEIIVLDSDTDDEPTSDHPTAPASDSSSDEDSSAHSESAYAGAPPAMVDFEMGEQECPESRYADVEPSYHRAVEEESEFDERDEYEEHEESDERESNHEDDRVHESDMTDEPARDFHKNGLPSEMALLDPEQQDYDEEMEDAVAMEEVENLESHPTIQIDSDADVPADQDPGEEQPGNIDPSLFDMAGSQLAEQSEKTEDPDRQEGLSESENANVHIHGDGQFECPILSSAIHDGTELLSSHEPGPEPTIEGPEGPEPLGDLGLSTVMPQFERQLPTPDPTQETIFTRETHHDYESAISSLEENEDATGMVQPVGSPGCEQDDTIAGEFLENTQENHDHEVADATATPELAQLTRLHSTPQRSCSVEVLISTESPKPPTVLITKPTVPDRSASGLRSKLSYFAPLSTLFDHYNALVDTISIVHEASPITRAKTGSKDWFVTIDLTDPSMAGTTVRAQIFRRYKSSMPSLAEGTAILLRDFKVKSLDHTVMLVSVESSAWAVFGESSSDAEMNGPPVEYDSQERAYASGLRRWYVEVGSGWVADRMLQASIGRESLERDVSPSSRARSESSSPDSKRGSQRRRRGKGKVAIHELRDGTRYTDAGSPNSRNSTVHELRDGTLYATL